MGLSITLNVVKETEIHWQNITHNLGKMADKAGIYDCLWCPEKLGITFANQLIVPLEVGILRLKSNPEEFKQYDSENGWGTYEHFIPWLEELLKACRETPTATIWISK